MIVEKRTFINQSKYQELQNYFDLNSKSKKHFNQIIYKYKSDVDFRLIFDKELAILRLRGIANMEDDLIVPIDVEDVNKMKLMLRNLGMHVDIKWFRHRTIYFYKDYTVTLDETYQYGYVVSISKEVPDIKMQEAISKKLDTLFYELQIPITTQEQFNDRYKYYKYSWVDVANKINETVFLQK